MTLVGYLNRSRSYPSPLIAVGADGDGLFAVYPSGDKVRLRGVESLEALRKRDSFVPAPSEDGSVPNLAFGISPRQVIAGKQTDVGRLLRSYVAQQGPLVQGDDVEAIRAFLLSIGEFAGRINARELLDVLSGKRRVTARINERRLRRSKLSAQTLVVQLEGKRQTKTLYRKGLPHGNQPADVQIPAATIGFLQQRLFN
ncbi:MAG: hypothetical protein JF606_24335 [Burkholderiales bacterium]|jgi:hypothetical protein|nr:hypothetical protein [Burkholderiales bacterium]